MQQVGPTGVWQFVAEGKSQGMAGVPDWIALVQAAGVKVKIIPTEKYFPHMAQGIAASDEMIKQKPEMIRKFVTAAMRGMKDMMDDPDKAAEEFVIVRAGVEGQGRRRQVRLQHVRQARLSRPEGAGRDERERLSKLQDFYLEKGFIQKKTPVE